MVSITLPLCELYDALHSQSAVELELPVVEFYCGRLFISDASFSEKN